MFGSRPRPGGQRAVNESCLWRPPSSASRSKGWGTLRQIFRCDKVTETQRLPRCEPVLAFICSGRVHEIIRIYSLRLCFIGSWQNLQCHKSKQPVWLALLSTVTSADSSKNRNKLGYRFLSDFQHNICLQTSKHQIYFHESLTLYLCFFIHKVLSWESIFRIFAAGISAVKGILFKEIC